MSENGHVCEPIPDFRVTFPGPVTEHAVAVENWTVPFLKAELGDEDRLRLILDERFGLELSSEEAERLVPFLAHAIAVALGYGGHPSKDMDSLPERFPHAAPRRIVQVGPLPEEPS